MSGQQIVARCQRPTALVCGRRFAKICSAIRATGIAVCTVTLAPAPRRLLRLLVVCSLHEMAALGISCLMSVCSAVPNARGAERDKRQPNC